MRIFIFTLLFLWSGFGFGGTTPSESFQELMQGNTRFVDGKLLHPNRDKERRIKTAIAQRPFAIVVSCSDSRVSPEILFDAGIGDLFVVRNAGNVISSVALASIGFSALYLGSNVILVLGHQDCGAVKAVLDGNIKDILPIASLIKPAVEKVKKQPDSTLEDAIKENVKNSVNRLKTTPHLADLIRKKKLMVVGGYYDLTSGKVKILDAP